MAIKSRCVTFPALDMRFQSSSVLHPDNDMSMFSLVLLGTQRFMNPVILQAWDNKILEPIE